MNELKELFDSLDKEDRKKEADYIRLKEQEAEICRLLDEYGAPELPLLDRLQYVLRLLRLCA